MWLICLVHSGWAATEPDVSTAPISISGWSVATYNDHLVAEQARLIDRLETLMANASPESAEALDLLRLQARAEVADFAAEMERIPAWKGDSGLRDALADSAAVMLSLYDTEVVELYALCSKGDIRASDLDTFSAVLTRLRSRAKGADDAVQAAQRKFAKAQHLVIRPAKEPEVKAEFSFPGIVPEGDPTSAAMVVAFSVAWQNGHTADASSAIEALNQVMGSLSDEPERIAEACTAADAAIAAARARVVARGPWRGDTAFHQATLTLIDTIQAEMGNGIRSLAAARGKPFKSQAQVDRYNVLIQEVNGRYGNAVSNFGAEQLRFQDRVGITAYTAWHAEHPSAAP